MYYWLRTYLLERRDVANKSEFGRIAMAQQRMQQNVSGAGGGSASENQAQGSQSGGAVGPHDGGNSQVQESERSTAVEGNVHSGNDQALQQGSSNINDGGQNPLRRNNGALGLVASAASAFDAAKDIMEALRSKHSNLASELEVTSLILARFSVLFCY